MPKFRPHQASAKRHSQPQHALDEVPEGSPERQASAEPEGHDVPSKRASAPVGRTPGKDDREKSPEECVVLLPKEEPSESRKPDDDDKLLRSFSEKPRSKLQRQDESVV